MYKQYSGGIAGVGSGLNEQKPPTASQYKRNEPYIPSNGNNSSGIEKSPERLRRSMTPNFDINQNKSVTGENSVNYSRVSYKPSFDGTRLDTSAPQPKTMVESVSASGLQGKSYDSASKPGE